MAIDPRKAATVDPDFEIFFRELGEAVRMVESDHQKSIRVEKGRRIGDIYYDSEISAVMIEIFENEPTQPTMLVP